MSPVSAMPRVTGHAQALRRGLHIIIYSQYFPPETGAPQARLHELAVRLRRYGHRITVLTAMPNYPDGKVFDGYRYRVMLKEELDGIRVVRTAVVPSRSARAVPRMLSYLSFMLSSLALGAWRTGRADLLIFESPPLFLTPAALLLGRILGAKTVMNVSDIWPDILVRLGSVREGPALRLMLWLERIGYRRSDVVALTNPGAVQQVRARFPDVSTTVISNGVDLETFRPELRSEAVRRSLGGGAGETLVVYCGLLGVAQGLESVIHAAGELRDRPDIRFVIMGDGPQRESLLALANELKLPNLRLMKRRPRSEIAGILASADIGVVPLVARLPGTMPSKIYEILASGLPVVVAGGCEGEALVKSFNVGRIYEPMDAVQMAAAIRSLVDDEHDLAAMKKRSRMLAERFSRDSIAQRTETILRAVAAGESLPDVEW